MSRESNHYPEATWEANGLWGEPTDWVENLGDSWDSWLDRVNESLPLAEPAPKAPKAPPAPRKPKAPLAPREPRRPVAAGVLYRLPDGRVAVVREGGC
jgi:hypothetical protein